FVEVGEAPGFDAPGGELLEVERDVGGDRPAAGPAVLGVELGHPNPYGLEEGDVVAVGVELAAAGAQRVEPVQPRRRLPEPFGEGVLSGLDLVFGPRGITQVVDGAEHGLPEGLARPGRQLAAPV